MMPPGDTPSKPTATTKTCSPNTKDNENSDQQGGGGGDGGGRKTTKAAAAEQGLKCPRCDSPNTKFCYYNNYSLTQPRHFCKTCRRYWTKGGALRNVPIGGGCRKSKKGKPSSSSSSISYSRAFSCDSARDSGSSSDLSGLRYLHGLSSPPMDFHLGGLTFPIPSRLQHHQQPPMATTAAFYSNQFSSFGDVVPGATTTASASSAIDYPSGSSLIGLNYPFCSSDGNGSNGAIIHGGMNNNFEGSSSLASSIESLSSLNQDLHWKLQQQRLAMLFVGDNQHKDDHNNSNGNGNVSFSPVVVDLDHHHHHHHQQQQQQQQRPQPILFENLEISKAGAAATTVDADTRATEWFFGNSHAHTPTTTTSSGCNGHEDSWMMSSSGVHGWPDLQPHPQQQYSSLP